MKCFKKLSASLFFSLLVANVAIAHPLDLGVINIVGHGKQVHARLELNPQVGAKILDVKPIQFTSAVLDGLKTKLFMLTLGAGKLSIDGVECDWKSNETAKIENPQLLAIDVDAECAKLQGDLKLSLPFLKNLDSSYRMLAMVRLEGVEHVAGADPAHSDLKFSFKQQSYGFLHFAWMGFEHIGVAPSEWKDESGFRLPKGIDHILFVVALLLAGGTLSGFLKTITGFTLGHTTSLALVTFGMVQISGRWIEAAIALTIALVASQALIGKTIKHRIRVTFCIGLIHGLGFAAALSGLNLDKIGLMNAVLGFNVGVEVGQATIVLVFLPLLIYLHRHLLIRKYFVKIVGAIIFVASSFWFIQRAFL